MANGGTNEAVAFCRLCKLIELVRSPPRYVEKQCTGNSLFNPTKLFCDYPESVLPLCVEMMKEFEEETGEADKEKKDAEGQIGERARGQGSCCCFPGGTVPSGFKARSAS